MLMADKRFDFPTIGVIGAGFVGGAIINAFKNKHLKFYDKNPKLSQDSFTDTINQDFVFVCVPTPMKDKLGSECNLSIIYECFDDINNSESDSIFIIKSTVPIGTTLKLQKRYKKLNIVHSPEFLTAKFANEDFLNADRHIVGYSTRKKIGKKVLNLFKFYFPDTPCFLMKSNNSESVKYFANCFFATKVSFFNEMFLLCEKLNLDWGQIIEGVMSDSRIGNTHYKVPGHDGFRGFGGTCFPKDINALIALFKENKINPLMLNAAWETNLIVRKNLDWAEETSAVSK